MRTSNVSNQQWRRSDSPRSPPGAAEKQADGLIIARNSTGIEALSNPPPMSDSVASDDGYLTNGDRSGCDLILVFMSTPYRCHRSILEKQSDFIQHWARFPGSTPSVLDISSSLHDTTSCTDDQLGPITYVDPIDDDISDLPMIEIEIGNVWVPFAGDYHAVDETDFRNYLRMVYEVWSPKDDVLSALKIVPITDYMQSRRIREICDLDAAGARMQWSTRHCYTAFEFARRWSLPHLSAAISTWIDANVPCEDVRVRLLSSTADYLLALLPELDMDPIEQFDTLVRYVCRKPRDADLRGPLRVEAGMVDVLCRGYRGLYGRWTRSQVMLEVMRRTRSMTFPDVDDGRRVLQCLLEIVLKQLEAGPLTYRGEWQCDNIT